MGSIIPGNKAAGTPRGPPKAFADSPNPFTESEPPTALKATNASNVP